MNARTYIVATVIGAALALLAPTASAGWTQHPGPVVSPVLPWEQVDNQEPSVVYDAPSHTFRMWYTGADEQRCMVGYATSVDGVTWAKLDHPVIGWGYGGVKSNACHSNVQRLAGRYYAWFAQGNLYEAVSDDGVTWTPLPKAAIRAAKKGWNTSLANSYVVRANGHWVMFWESFGEGLWRMSTATSPDLVHWTPTGRILKGIGFGGTFGGPCVMHEANGWTMYFHAPPPVPLPGVSPWYSQVYEAHSPDLVHWVTDPVPLITREQPSWEVDQIADPSVVVVRGRRLMFFDGLDNSWPVRSSIGLAILDLG